ncbi:hypothetical protein BT63DRAFT_458178 [Microthyrium microscopicum]|uniref:Uncharacterized protein n=1 Tax=Microthyrium microscopicum TaxID=703497 RepID=A0A6A6U5L4_9PEZI|nr:hypothetical protein BT63DRAFT_458178 [Microthyrium microscopicum]
MVPESGWGMEGMCKRTTNKLVEPWEYAPYTLNMQPIPEKKLLKKAYWHLRVTVARTSALHPSPDGAYSYQQDQPASISAYLSLLADCVGEESANKVYEDMSDGRLAVPSPKSLADHELGLERASVDNWHLEFNENSINGPERTVRRLKVRSPAENAGMRNGDRIMNTVRFREVQHDHDALMRVIVSREDERHIDILT